MCDKDGMVPAKLLNELYEWLEDVRYMNECYKSDIEHWKEKYEALLEQYKQLSKRCDK